jgi:hypothetical protein
MTMPSLRRLHEPMPEDNTDKWFNFFLNFENHQAKMHSGRREASPTVRKMKVTQSLSALLIAILICPQAAANAQPKQFTRSQLRQFVHCLLRTKIISKKYGPNLHFRYMFLPPVDVGEEGGISAVFIVPAL